MKSPKNIQSGKSPKQKIALDSPIVIENLPLKNVHYPNHYGTFIGFAENPECTPYFCECAKAAIENHFKLRSFESKSEWVDDKINAPLSSHFFPNLLSELSLKKPIEHILQFKKKICHRCNLATPSLTYCHPMYGGNFIQYFGWYINQTSLRLGLRNGEYIENYTPDEFISIIKRIQEINIKREYINSITKSTTDPTYNELKIINKEISKLGRNLTNKIENITREEFGFRKIGEGNVSEAILIKIIERLYPNLEILIHHRPSWLEGLELDIYIPEINLGIEYQGQQHFYPIEAWGGESSFLQLQERDARKKKLCKKFGVRLIEIDFTEPLLEEYVKEKTSA